MELWLKLVTFVFEGTNTLIILDNCAASKDVLGRTGQLVQLAFSAWHIGISVWVLTQKITSITAAKITKAIFEDYAGEMALDDYKNLIKKLKEQKLSYLVFSLRHPHGVKLFLNKIA